MERSGMKEKDSSSSQTVKKDMGCMERNRREKMTEYYSTLQSIVPNLFPKATRARVIDEAISYIKSLEETVITLEATKSSRRQHAAAETESAACGNATNTSIIKKKNKNKKSNNMMRITNNTQLFTLSLESKPGIVTQVLQVFENHNAEVLACSVTTPELNKLLVSLTVLLPDLPASFLRIKDDLLLIV